MTSKIFVMDIAIATIQAGWLGEKVPSVEIPTPEKLFNTMGTSFQPDVLSTLLSTVVHDKLKVSNDEGLTGVFVIPSMMTKVARELLTQLALEDVLDELDEFFLKSSASSILFSSDLSRMTLPGKSMPHLTGLAVRADKKTSLCAVDAVYDDLLLAHSARIVNVDNALLNGSFIAQSIFPDAAISYLADAIVGVVLSTDTDTRSLFYKNLVLSGSRVNETGFYEKLRKNIAEKAPKGTLVGMTLDANPESAAWRGAARYAASEGFAEITLTKPEYDEAGPDIVHVKFPF
ncbi:MULTISPECIES: syringactin [Pseudomonas syringae group]|uniref:Actin-like protein n=1 Tax=Pseudomonas syringae pv. ribicola TaxID=55398 RepID=A0A3M2VR36_PSESI|nr:syringactin [Pseudomonas syringae group genomosp. 3]RML40898.1 Actin-like protein [Pseudomonas syringae pv. ribicola]